MDENATGKQIDYINNLIANHSTPVQCAPDAHEFVQAQTRAENERTAIYRSFYQAISVNTATLTKTGASEMIDFLKGNSWNKVHRIRALIGEQAYNIGAIIAVSRTAQVAQALTDELGVHINAFVGTLAIAPHVGLVPPQKLRAKVADFIATQVDQDDDDLWLEYHCLANC